MKVYIASPFFNPEQLERVEFIEKILVEHDIEYFSPRKDTYVKPDSNDAERKHAFDENLRGIIEADFIIAVTDGKDMGTIFEAGYAYGKNIPIVYFAETLGQNQFNLMLAMSGISACKTREDLDMLLKRIKLVGVENINDNFLGEIE